MKASPSEPLYRILSFKGCRKSSSQKKIPRPLSKRLCSILLKGRGIFTNGDPGGIRTHGLSLRRRPLYPAELRDHMVLKDVVLRGFPLDFGVDGGSRRENALPGLA
jgi:hypothetical protein